MMCSVQTARIYRGKKTQWQRVSQFIAGSIIRATLRFVGNSVPLTGRHSWLEIDQVISLLPRKRAKGMCLEACWERLACWLLQDGEKKTNGAVVYQWLWQEVIPFASWHSGTRSICIRQPRLVSVYSGDFDTSTWGLSSRTLQWMKKKLKKRRGWRRRGGEYTR